MKQLTSEPAVKRMTTGFALPLTRRDSRRHTLEILRPDASLLPLSLELWEVVAELDPGMVDWTLHAELRTTI